MKIPALDVPKTDEKAGNSSGKGAASPANRKAIVNVCHLVSGDLWAGAASQVSNLLSELIKHTEFHFSAVTFNPGRLTDELKESGIPVLCIPESETSAVSIVKKLSNHIMRQNVDIIHCHGHKEHILGCFARIAAHRSFKVVRTLHGMPEPYRGLAGLRAQFSKTLQELTTLLLTDRIIVVSHDMQRRLRNKLWAKKIVCIHNGINPGKIKRTVSAEDMRKQLGISQETFVIGTACRLVPIKRLDLLLDTFAVVNRKYSRSLLIICGDGPLNAELRARSRISGIAEQVRFLGHRDDLYDVMSVFDVFVMTSEHEGVPMVLLEALALGIPIVAPSVGGIPEILGQRTTLLDPLTREALADSIIQRIDIRSLPPAETVLKATISSVSASRTATETASVYAQLSRSLKK